MNSEKRSSAVIQTIKDRLRQLYPFEKIVIVYVLFAHVIANIFNFKLNYLVEYFFSQVAGALLLGCLLCGGYFLFFIIRNRNNNKALIVLREYYFNNAFFLDSFRIILAVTITLIFFCNLKQIIPLVHPKLFDSLFWDLDIFLHFGLSPTLIALKIPKDSWVWPFMDKLYLTFFLKNMLVPWIFILQRKSKRLRDAVISAVCLLWIIGGLVYFLLPAMGPCYFKPELFKDINMPLNHKLQKFLLEEYVHFIRNPLNYQAKTFYGIAAMPALHVAVPLLFTLFCLRLNKFLFLILLFYTILIWLSSIMLGWHYAIDGYAGVLLAVSTYLFSCRYILLQK